jgi:2-amino-4-hydroxy-6-hydroxymethyldihydropteridine diphosphokinase
MYYVISIGSNIQPEQYVVKAISLLAERFGSLYLYPAVYTQAQAVESDHLFINSLLVLQSNWTASRLKTELCQIEELLGRDRSDPRRSVKDRSCDLDILWQQEDWSETWRNSLTESYLQQVFAAESPVAKLQFESLLFAERPAAIYFQAQASDKLVFDQKPDALKNWLKAGFLCN